MNLDFTPLPRLPFSLPDLAGDTTECVVAAILTAAIVIGNDLYASVPLALEKYGEILAALRNRMPTG